jgi:RecB family exonuclease
MGKSRPRIPSFYALEAVRAAEGELPLFEKLSARAERVTESRVGWPAPRAQEEAIDEAEYDLAALDRLGSRGEAAVRASGHLLAANPHLKRALRARAYRWNVPKWTWADGFLKPSAAAREAIAKPRLDVQAYSATALQNFAACPYRFFLHAIMGLRPREESEAIEELHPLEKGSLVHEAQFEILTRLQDEGLLPVRAGSLDAARERLDEVLDEVAARWHDRLVPAIERVWEDEIHAIRADLREWLRRESEEDAYEPWRFELSFGLRRDPGRDRHSTPDPVALDCGITLRGAIDLVERANGTLRITDHKTGSARLKKRAVIDGGKTLQPVFYALTAEKLFPELEVASGRLYYCTAKGGYETREVELNAEARGSAEVVARIVGRALEEGRLPALPESGACDWCDYLPVCGPDEERRTKKKPEERPLVQLRGLP